MTLPTSFLQFANSSPSPFHAIEATIQRLVSKGFSRIAEEDSWSALQPNKSYFFTRNASALIAFRLPAVSNRFVIIGAHSDSPCLKLKPKSYRSKEGCILVGVECYGGGLWHTWFDRDLALAGRVMVEVNGVTSHRLVRINKAILRIPTLAIHLDRAVNDSFTFNKETNMTPVLALQTATEKSLNDHPLVLLELIAKDLEVDPSEIKDFELCLYDLQPASIGGIRDEFIHSARLDNLMMSFCALTAITESSVSNVVQVLALFDNEEVGSQTAHGADSNMLEVTLKRLAALNHEVSSITQFLKGFR